MQLNSRETKVPIWLLLVVLIASLLMANCFSSDEEEPTPEAPTPTQVMATSTPPPTVLPPTATATVAAMVEATAMPAEEAKSAQAAGSDPYPAPKVDTADTKTKSAAPVAESAYPPPSQIEETSAQSTTIQTTNGATSGNTSTEQPYPGPSGPRGPDFTIDPATKADDTVVRGSGPAGVSIRLVNASYSDETLGKGKIGEDGKFEIEVTALPGGDRLGIMLEDLSGTEYKITDFVNNENYRDLPMVGLLVAFFDIPR